MALRLSPRWFVVVIVLVAVAGISVVWMNAVSKSEAAHGRGQHWPSGVSAAGLRDLRSAHWKLAATSSRGATTDEGPIVNAAVSQMGWLDASRVQSVTFMAGRNTSAKVPAAAQKTSSVWVIEFNNVVVPDLSGKGGNSNPGTMVALVDADTLKFLYASSY